MRRSNREITDVNEILKIVGACKVIRIAMQDDDGLYVVPLNFGYDFDGEVFTFFCHSAKDGRKIDAIKKDPNVAFEMDCEHALVEAEKPCGYSYKFASIIGTGTVKFLESEEKKTALKLLMKHQADKDFKFDEKIANGVAIFSITPKTLSTKANR